MGAQNEGRFNDLLAQAIESPQLSWVGVDPPSPCSPLEFAFARRHAWGVQQLLDRGYALTPPLLASFFEEIRTSRVNGDLVGSQLVKNFWPVLLPSIATTPALQHWVVRYYFEHQQEGRLAREVDWDTLSMMNVIGDLLEEPVLHVETMDVTPLQYACLTANHSLMATLMVSGADGHRQEPRSGLPGWTLATCVEAAQVSLDQSWSVERLQRWMWKEWGCESQKPASEGGKVNDQAQRLQARSWFWNLVSAGSEERRKRIGLLLKEQAIGVGLPEPAPSRKGPRF
jgi:hypothetical protein